MGPITDQPGILPRLYLNCDERGENHLPPRRNTAPPTLLVPQRHHGMQGAVPLLVVQGEKDAIHPMNGGNVTLLWFSYRGRVLSAFDTAQTFAKRLGVTSTLQQIHLDPRRSGDPTPADGFLWPGAPSPVVALYKIEGGGHVVPQPVFRYPRILGHTTTAVDMPKLMIEMFHISSK